MMPPTGRPLAWALAILALLSLPVLGTLAPAMADSQQPVEGQGRPSAWLASWTTAPMGPGRNQSGVQGLGFDNQITAYQA